MTSTPSDLTSLVSSNATSTVYPSEETILSVIQSRFRADLNYTRIGSKTLLAVNPLRPLANLNDASAEAYMQKCYRDVDWEQKRESQPDEAMPPHPYELALRVYHKMKRSQASQAIVYSGLTNGGKSFLSKLVTSQLLRISCQDRRKEQKISDQIHALQTLTNAFGCAKTKQNGNASRISRYLELHFTSQGRLGAAKLLTFGLDKSRLYMPLAKEERTFHVFYQLLAGASHEERVLFKLQDVTSYTLLSSSGCYRLSGGPSSDDSIAMEELRAAMKTLGFKQKQLNAISGLLSAILLLGNITFTAPTGEDSKEAAKVSSPQVLDDVAELLGVSSEDLEQALTTQSRMIRKEVISSMLSPIDAQHQRDSLSSDLYATLFAYVIETANQKVASTGEEAELVTQITQLDPAGFQTSSSDGTSAESSNSLLLGHHDFATNLVAEGIQTWLQQLNFGEESLEATAMVADGVKLPEVPMGYSTACLELLRGDARIGEGSSNDRKPTGLIGTIDKFSHRVRGGKAKADDADALLTDLDTHKVHTSYSSGSPFSSTLKCFSVSHYQGQCSYSLDSFITQEQDIFDSNFVQLLRSSEQPFLARLFAGPSLAIEAHPRDENVVVNAQVSVRPLRQPSPMQPDRAPLDALLDPQKPYSVSRQFNATIAEILFELRGADCIWTVFAVRPNDIDQPNSFDSKRVKSQVTSMLVPELVARKRCEYIGGYKFADFCQHYAQEGVYQAAMAAGVVEEREKVQAFVIANAFRDTLDYTLGETKIWLSYSAWRRLEDRKRCKEPREIPKEVSTDTQAQSRGRGSMAGDSQYPPTPKMMASHETEVLLKSRTSMASNPFQAVGERDSGSMIATPPIASDGWNEGWETKAGAYSTETVPPIDNIGVIDKESKLLEGRAIDSVEEEPTTRIRRWWVRLTWAMTWWIPSLFLSKCGGMKRPDVQMAWREKVTLCMIIFLCCGFILFYIIGLGRLLCPDNLRAWNKSQLSQHNTPTDYYVAVRGKVYDLTKFWKLQHSDSSVQITNDVMLQLAGLDLTPYFPIALTVGCPGLVTNDMLALSTNSSSLDYTPTLSQAVHTTGRLSPDQTSRLADVNWYPNRFLPFMQTFYKGFYVVSKKDIQSQANDRNWAIIDKKVYDLSNYVWSTSLYSSDPQYRFLPDTVSSLFAAQSGADVSADFHTAMNSLNTTYRLQTQNCLDNVFYAGKLDFREEAQCQVQNYLLLSFSILLMLTILSKFIAALQLSPKRTPEQQDKFIICQVPCYTEGEEELKKTIDSLACLQYDDKRKLLFLICDGMIVGSGNELPTPRIVLDILGVDPKINPEPLMFKSVAEGSKQLNYGKVYSGLYEFQGHVVPYIVVVKVGRPSERSRPGNRGKRDTQILLMRYLNRVHFDAPMYPLELEIYHQMKNVIGIDPAFYEYILTIDADTTVEPEGLNRLVAVAADDSSVIALCGETKLDNEEASVWTMIQVYEYYISHHLAKAFESLFGSVTCLPGCFSMYRIRSADKGRPLLISNRIIDAYSENKVDTLHKKNLLSLGEDRYLTTLLLKNFPSYRTKFSPDAKAHTNAPEDWSVLLSQRRRWINSTVHNLAELVLMPELCGFCLFSMRFIVFIDLIGTILLPATTVYLIYLIVTVATGTGPIPYISLALIAAVYGLQMIIFLLKRQWQYIGWLFIYLIAYPIWSFFLPLYSFWNFDDFGWGSTRIVVGEKGRKKIVAGTDDEPYDDSMIPLKRYSEYQRDVWKQPSDDAASIRSGMTSATSVKGPFGNRNAANMPVVGYSSSYYAGSAAGSDYGGNGGDYYQSTNVLNNKSGANSRRTSTNNLLATPPSMGMDQFAQQQQQQQQAHLSMAPGYPMPSMYGMPMNPASTMYGMPMGSGSMFNMGSAPSMYGMPGGVMTMNQLPAYGHQSPATSEFGGPARIPNQLTGGAWPTLPASGSGNFGNQARYSTSTLLGGGGGGGAQGAPQSLPLNLSSNPTDEELARAVRQYLSIQADLMQVSKRSVREAVIASFPNAKRLNDRKTVINKAIDDTLSGAMQSSQ